MPPISEKEKAALVAGRIRSAPPVLEIHEAIRSEGEHELARPVTALMVSGLAAGLSMGFSFVAESSLAFGVDGMRGGELISKLGYSVGFLIVILGRQQLFTENTLTPILAVFSKPSWQSLGRLMQLWVVVLLANLCGAALFAAYVSQAPVFGPEMIDKMNELALETILPGAKAVFFKGILGGWLIAMMVWLLPFAETARISVIVIITYLVGVGHLSHVIAGSVEGFYAVFAGLAPVTVMVGDFLLPTLAGNVLGGVALVSMLHHAQVRFDHHHGSEEAGT